jgi:hypothetical protein
LVPLSERRNAARQAENRRDRGEGADAVKAQLKQADEARSERKVAGSQTVSDSTDHRVGATLGTLIDVLA